MSRISWKGHTSMLGANLIWGLMSPIAKMVMQDGQISAIVLTLLRVGGAMALFWLLGLFRKSEHVSSHDMFRLMAASLLAIVFNQGCFIVGVGLTSPADASIIGTSMPLWAMLLAAIYLKEPITAKKVEGLMCGAIGALILILGSRTSTEGISTGWKAMWGNLLVLFAQLSYAFYFVLYKNFVNRYTLVTTMKWMFTYAFIFLIPFTFREVTSTPWTQLSSEEIWGSAYVVAGGTFVSYMLVVIGQRLLRPTVAGMYNYVQPLMAGGLAILWGMDHFTVSKGISVLLIAGGVALVSASKSRKDMESERRNAR